MWQNSRGSAVQTNKQQGFTLIELMIAITVFSMLSLGAYQILNGVMRSDAIAEEHSKKLKQLQRSFTVLERDFDQTTARPLRYEAEKPEAPFMAGKFLLESEFDGISFVRLGWRNPQGQLPRSGLQRVAYIVREEQLVRLYHLYPDAVVGTEPREEILLSGVKGFSLQYNKNKKWAESWSDKQSIPDGIKLTIELENFGKIERIFILPQGVIPPAPTTKNQNNRNNSTSTSGSTDETDGTDGTDGTDEQ